MMRNAELARDTSLRDRRRRMLRPAADRLGEKDIPMADPQTILDATDGVAVLTLNRPDKRNALSRALRDEIVARLGALAKDDAVRAVVLTGAPPAFCAGFDRSELAGGDMAEVFANATEYHHRVYTFPKPLIAAVNGPALGGGCDLAAMCDFRLAAATAVFGQPQVRFGAAAAYDLMRTIIGTGPARELCLTGRSIAAAEAQAVGLVNRVLEPAELLDAALALAREIAALPDGMAESAKRGFVAHQPRLFEA
jgi:enoyl-CoA hydratase/carnithine racemase